jgi:hypothetical protein
MKQTILIAIACLFAVAVTSGVKAETAHEKALQSYGNFMVGGVWTRTDEDGNDLEHVYRWVFDKHFLEMKTVKDPDPRIGYHGIDTLTGEFKVWGFGAGGFFGTGVIKQESEKVWILTGKGKGPNGHVKGSWKFTKLSDNEVQSEAEMTLDGEKLTSKHVWKRK